MSQLRDDCTSVRQKQPLISLTSSDDLLSSVRALDDLDTTACAASILRHYNLVQLVKHRDARQNHHRVQDPRGTPRQLKYGHIKLRALKASEGSGRALSQALSEILFETYPELRHVPDNRDKSDSQYQKKY